MALPARNPYCVVKDLDFETAGFLKRLWQGITPPNQVVPTAVLRDPPQQIQPSTNRPLPQRPPPFNPDSHRSRPPPFNPDSQRSRPRPPPYSALDPNPPPRYSDIAFVEEYRDPFYDKHLMYQVVGLHRHDPFEFIQQSMTAWTVKTKKDTDDVTDILAIGRFFYVMMAGDVFGNKETKKKYDKDGDPEISKVSSTIKGKDPKFYQNHCLYEVAGAQKDDNFELLTIALKKSMYRVLQGLRNRKTVDVKANEHFKMLWFKACYILINNIRRAEYNAATDTDYGLSL